MAEVLIRSGRPRAGRQLAEGAGSALGPRSQSSGPNDVALAGEHLQAGDVDVGVQLLQVTASNATDTDNGALLALALTGMHMFLDRVATAPDEILAAVRRTSDAPPRSLRLSTPV